MSNFAFIDAQNVFLGVKHQGWTLDWRKLRVYLKDNLSVSKAYLFIGYIPTNSDLYTALQDRGYTLIFKQVMLLKDGRTKGNVDAELVLQAMIDYNSYDQSVIISGDGDFACLVRYLYQEKKLCRLLVPDSKRYSVFLNKAAKEKLDSIDNCKHKVIKI